jgi:tetratricopeptide (TPR) repeat protein
MDVHQSVLAQANEQRFDEAEATLAAAAADHTKPLEDSCAGLMLNNLAALSAFSGRVIDAERYAQRAVNILEKIYPADDLVMLRPLQVLAAARFEQGKFARAREAFNRMRLVRADRPEDRALVHGMAASLLHFEHKHQEAETEYFAAISALESAGQGDSADTAGFFNSLGALYIELNRLDDAQRALDRALTIFSSSKDALAMDRIKLLNVRAALHARQGKWSEAEQDLRDAISLAGCESATTFIPCASILTNYAYVLRKNHHGREARSIDTRITALYRGHPSEMVVDVSELIAPPKTSKK